MHQVHPQASPRGYKFTASPSIPPIQIVRLPLSSNVLATNVPRKRPMKQSGDKSGVKRGIKAEVVLDPRGAAIRAMMQESLKQAQEQLASGQSTTSNPNTGAAIPSVTTVNAVINPKNPPTNFNLVVPKATVSLSNLGKPTPNKVKKSPVSTVKPSSHISPSTLKQTLVNSSSGINLGDLQSRARVSLAAGPMGFRGAVAENSKSKGT